MVIISNMGKFDETLEDLLHENAFSDASIGRVADIVERYKARGGKNLNELLGKVSRLMDLPEKDARRLLLHVLEAN